MRRLRAAAVSSRDGYGHAFGVVVAGGKMRVPVAILSDGNRKVGEVVPDGPGSGIAHWQAEVPITSVEARAQGHLATSGRLTAIIDESDTVIAFRVESRVEMRSRRTAGSRRRLGNLDGERLEYGYHPGGRILRTG